MTDSNKEIAIEQTINWIKQVVIDCNFCPFASRPLNEGRIHFSVTLSADPAIILEETIRECYRLDENEDIETCLLIMTNGFENFDDYLDILSMAEALIEDQEYEGIYQLASFHPGYCFEGADETDPANYTNRSPYPMLHFLRESSVEKALLFYKEPEKIPENNIRFTKDKGLLFMQQLRNQCFNL